MGTECQAQIDSPVIGTDDREAQPKCWYAARVQMNCENRVEKQINRLGIETYLPLAREIHKWSDRNKLIFRKVIPMIVFIKANPDEMEEVIRLSTVYQLVSAPGSRKPAVIPDKQIEQLKYMLGNWDGEIFIEELKVKKGTPIKIARGPLKGLEGIATCDSEGKQKISIIIGELYCASVNINVNDLASSLH